MGLSLCGWAGDHVVGLQGRRSQRLLLTLAQRDGGVPSGLVHTLSNGILYYPDLSVRCLTPGARDAIALAVEQLDAFVWSIEIAEVDFGDGRSPWAPGVHLFCIMLQPDGSSEESRTFATAVVDASLQRVELFSDPVAQMDVFRFSN
jgi:hypothetical protein